MRITTIFRGGLGNCLFMAATVIAYSLKYKINYCLPKTIENPHSENQKVYYSDKLNYCDKSIGEEHGTTIVHYEQNFHYEEIPKYDCDLLILQGYWQSWRYINEYRTQILTLLNIPKSISYGRIFLHYRLGDYKQLTKFHQIISDDYIVKALELFYGKGYRDIIVFSDEIDVAKEKFAHVQIFNWQFSEDKTELQDLSLMAACSGGIMSASSFSWWGAWLGNKDRMIVYPKNWFGTEAKHDTKDLCPPNWIAL